MRWFCTKLTLHRTPKKKGSFYNRVNSLKQKKLDIELNDNERKEELENLGAQIIKRIKNTFLFLYTFFANSLTFLSNFNASLIFAGNSNISSDRFRELVMATGELVMDVGTILDGENAVKEGLIDAIGNLKDAMAYLYSKIDKTEWFDVNN